MNIILLILFSCILPAAETQLMIFGLSYHGNQPKEGYKELNGYNPGLGLMYETGEENRVGIATGVYWDSYEYLAKFVGINYDAHFMDVGSAQLRACVLAGVVKGSTLDHTMQVMVVPNLSAEYANISAHVGAVPAIYSDGEHGAIIMGWLQYRL